MSTKLKSTVNAELFCDAITKASKALGRSVLPTLENVKITFTEKTCTITGTDLAHWLDASIPAYGDSFSLILKDTKSMMKACKYFTGDIMFEVSPNADDKGNLKYNKLTLISGDRTATQDCIDDIYPDYPDTGEMVLSCTANAKTLAERINQVKYAVADVGHSKPILTGVCFMGENVAAIDGYRMALNTDPNLNIDGEFVLPVKDLKLLDVFGNNDVTIEVSPKYVVFTYSDAKLCIRRLEGEYYNIKGLIPSDASIKEIYTVNTAEYLKELKFLNDMIGSQRKEFVKFDDGKLRVLTKRGNFSTKINVDGIADVIYGFECRYMLDALNHLKDAKTVTVKVYGALSPIIMTGNTSDTDIAFVLPARIDQYDKEMAA